MPDGESLRNVSDRKRWRTLDVALGEFDEPKRSLDEGRLAGAVRTDHADQFAPFDGQVDVPDDPALTALDADVAGDEEWIGQRGVLRREIASLWCAGPARNDAGHAWITSSVLGESRLTHMQRVLYCGVRQTRPKEYFRGGGSR